MITIIFFQFRNWTASSQTGHSVPELEKVLDRDRTYTMYTLRTIPAVEYSHSMHKLQPHLSQELQRQGVLIDGSLGSYCCVAWVYQLFGTMHVCATVRLWDNNTIRSTTNLNLNFEIRSITNNYKINYTKVSMIIAAPAPTSRRLSQS